MNALKQLLADLFGLPVSPSAISAAIGTISTGGKLTITNGAWNGDAIGVAYGGTGLTSGTSGGIVGYTATGVLASSVALTASALVLGGGAGATPTPMASLGTTTTILHGNAAGAPTFGAVSLTADVSGILPIANGGLASDTTGAATDSILRFNGTAWVAGTPATASAGPGIEFYNATPAIEVVDADNDVPINTLSRTPIVTAEQTVTGTGDGASTAITFGAWLYDTALGRTSIDAGAWQFETYVAINVAGGTTTLTRQVYAVVPVVTGTVTVTGTGTSRTATASAGTPFNTTDVTGSATSTTASYLQTPKGLYQISSRTSDTVVTILTPSGYTNDTTATFNVWRMLVSATTDDINDISPAYTLHTFNVVSGAFTITALTKLGAISFVTSTASRTITMAYNGTTHNTHFSTPLITMHNNLAGLDGGVAGQFYHLTSAQYLANVTNFTVAGPTVPRIMTFPDAAATILYSGGALGTPSGGTATNLTGLPLTAGVTGILPTANGGTGIAYFTAAGPSVARVYTFPDAATTVLTTNAAVTVAQGGTGLATLTDKNVILGAGTATPTFVAPSTSGNVLTSNGTTWTSAAAAGGSVVRQSVTIMATTFNPADATESFFGSHPAAPSAASDKYRIKVLTAMTLYAGKVSVYSSTAGSNEAWNLYVLHNNVTSHLIGSVATSANLREWSFTSWTIGALAVGDTLELWLDNPTWATNPSGCTIGGQLHFQ